MNKDLRFRNYYLRFALFIVLLFLNRHTLFSQDTSKYRLRVGDLNFGIDSRFLTTFDSAANSNFHTSVEGLTLRYQSSIILQHFDKLPERKFKVGDLLSAEIAAGFMQSNDPIQKLPIWFAYRFEMGAAFIYRFSNNFDANINLIILRFARDYVTQNISGSGIDLRLRYKRIIAEAGLGSRQLRILGFPTPYFDKSEEQNVSVLGLRYLISSDKNIGLRIELLDKNISTNREGLMNLRIYYGKYF